MKYDDKWTNNIQIPKAVCEYNLGMGKSDCMDQNINAYRIFIKRKKNGGSLYFHGFWMLVC